MQLTVAQYAKKLGKSRHTIYLWIKEGRLPDGVKLKDVAGHKIIEVK